MQEIKTVKRPGRKSKEQKESPRIQQKKIEEQAARSLSDLMKDVEFQHRPTEMEGVGIKPCPSCGSPGGMKLMTSGMWTAGCTAPMFCLRTRHYMEKTEALAVWNRRTNDEQSE